MAEAKNPNASDVEVKDFRAAADAEWGTYVALSTIAFNGATAYLPGDPVPTSNVERHGYLDAGVVAKVSSKAATDLIAGLHANTNQSPVELAAPVNLGVSVK